MEEVYQYIASSRYYHQDWFQKIESKNHDNKRVNFVNGLNYFEQHIVKYSADEVLLEFNKKLPNKIKSIIFKITKEIRTQQAFKVRLRKEKVLSALYQKTGLSIKDDPLIVKLVMRTLNNHFKPTLKEKVELMGLDKNKFNLVIISVILEHCELYN